MAARKPTGKAPSSLGAPYLRSIRSDPDRMKGMQFPFSIPAFRPVNQRYLPQRQLAFLRIIHALETPRHAQFLIATHSPILLAYPGATLYQFEDDGIRAVAYRETEHYRVTREFLNAPERVFRHLFSDEEEFDD